MEQKQELLKVAKPMLFNTKMVKKILDGSKTATSRNLNPKLKSDEYGYSVWFNKENGQYAIEKHDEDERGFTPTRYINLPYQVGEIVYVRETYTYGEIVYGENQYGDQLPYIESVDNGYFIPKEYAISEGVGIEFVTWKPSIHMPKKMARIFLRIINVEGLLLKDTTDLQAQKEGFNNAEEFIKEYLKIYPDKTSEEYIFMYEFEIIKYQLGEK